MSAVIENLDDGENNPRYSSECDTLRSSNQFQKEVDQALEKAQSLMKFKHDKEFINKVLDA